MSEYPYWLARWRALSSWSLSWLTLAREGPWLVSILTISRSPLHAARWRQQLPELSVMVVEAPHFRRRLTVSLERERERERERGDVFWVKVHLFPTLARLINEEGGGWGIMQCWVNMHQDFPKIHWCRCDTTDTTDWNWPNRGKGVNFKLSTSQHSIIIQSIWIYFFCPVSMTIFTACQWKCSSVRYVSSSTFTCMGSPHTSPSSHLQPFLATSSWTE